jgi:hypothetical protein
MMSTREPICALEVEEDPLLMTTLRTAEKVRARSNRGEAQGKARPVRPQAGRGKRAA